MKDNLRSDKIISFVFGLLIGWILVYSYSYITQDKTLGNWWPVWWSMWNFDASNMSEDQLERMATRAWITKDELKKRLDSGENLREIMPARTWSWSNFSWRRWNNSSTGTWSN